MGLLFKYNRPRSGGTWSGMVALVRTVVGVSLVGGLLVVLLWSEQQVGVKTPAHTHFHAHARGIPADATLEESMEKIDDSFRTVTERLELQPNPPNASKNISKKNTTHQRSIPKSKSPDLSPNRNSKPSSPRKSNHSSISFKPQWPPSPEPKSPLRVTNTAKPDSRTSHFLRYSSSSRPSSLKPHISNTSSSERPAVRSSQVPSPAITPPNINNNLVFNIDHSVPASNADMPKIYVITPTYRRPEQVAELTRLSQTLMLVPNLHWLVAEDSVAPTRRVLAFLDSCSVPHTYLLATASRRYKGANKPRGVSNRNAGLKWLKVHAKEGVFYFADDDNTYDYRIFNEMRWTKRVSMFPVGLVTRLGVSSPIVSDGKLIGFYDGWIAGRKFPVDMAGFAVNVQYYLQRDSPMMPYSVGFEEDGFLKALKIKPEEIEPLAENCTKILVWHTRTVKSVPALKMPDTDKVSKTNLNHLKPQMVFQMPFGLS